jgi:DNA-binding phage protein
MPLTHDFKQTVVARVQQDPEFRQALFLEAVNCILQGDVETGKAVLRDYVNATMGFGGLEKKTKIPSKSLMRMLGPSGSPTLANLAKMLTALQKADGVRLEVTVRK